VRVVAHVVAGSAVSFSRGPGAGVKPGLSAILRMMLARGGDYAEFARAIADVADEPSVPPPAVSSPDVGTRALSMSPSAVRMRKKRARQMGMDAPASSPPPPPPVAPHSNGHAVFNNGVGPPLPPAQPVTNVTSPPVTNVTESVTFVTPLARSLSDPDQPESTREVREFWSGNARAGARESVTNVTEGVTNVTSHVTDSARTNVTPCDVLGYIQEVTTETTEQPTRLSSSVSLTADMRAHAEMQTVRYVEACFQEFVGHHLSRETQTRYWWGEWVKWCGRARKYQQMDRRSEPGSPAGAPRAPGGPAKAPVQPMGTWAEARGPKAP